MTERWLTLTAREDIRQPELRTLIESVGRDYAKAWDQCNEPHWLIEMAAAAGTPVDVVVGAAARACADAWSHWSGGATDPRPMQVITGIQRWISREAGFEQIWSTWELAESVHVEVRAWHATQSGAVLASAILNAVDAVHALATVARDLAEPEPGHDQHDPARYARKNADPENAGLVHETAASVRLATSAGAYWHSHSEPNASQEAHDSYAKQIIGFVLRQHIDAASVVQGLRERAFRS